MTKRCGGKDRQRKTSTKMIFIAYAYRIDLFLSGSNFLQQQNFKITENLAKIG